MTGLPALAVLVAVACWIVPWIAAGLGVKLEGRVVPNYRGVPVALGLGWAWAAWGALALAAASLTGDAEGSRRLVSLGALVLGTALLGWVDDVYGSRTERGLAGHLRALRKGRVTTGLVKLVGIGGLSLWASWGLGSGPQHGWQRTAGVLLGAVVIAGCANLLNLLDLRPGRALKTYALLAVPCAVVEVAVAGLTPQLLTLAAIAVIAVAGPALACAGPDLRERAMLGDMGSNAAGALAGWLLASVLPPAGLAAAAAAVTALNVASERVSFSAVIEGNAVLRRLDEAGRVRHVVGEAQTRSGETGS